MAIFEFSCDAIVSRQIRADSEADAQKQWEEFCGAICADDFAANIPDVGVPSFHVTLQHDEPEVEQIE